MAHLDFSSIVYLLNMVSYQSYLVHWRVLIGGCVLLCVRGGDNYGNDPVVTPRVVALYVMFVSGYFRFVSEWYGNYWDIWDVGIAQGCSGILE